MSIMNWSAARRVGRWLASLSPGPPSVMRLVCVSSACTRASVDRGWGFPGGTCDMAMATRTALAWSVASGAPAPYG
eukprot:6309687-Prymnesium_polylepis.3